MCTRAGKRERERERERERDLAMLSDAFEQLFARFSNLMQGAQVEGVVSPKGMVRAVLSRFGLFSPYHGRLGECSLIFLADNTCILERNIVTCMQECQGMNICVYVCMYVCMYV